MAFTQDDLTALDNAIKRGVTRVSYADRSVEYRSLDEMMRVRKLMISELQTATKPRRTWPAYYRGLS